MTTLVVPLGVIGAICGFILGDAAAVKLPVRFRMRIGSATKAALCYARRLQHRVWVLVGKHIITVAVTLFVLTIIAGSVSAYAALGHYTDRGRLERIISCVNDYLTNTAPLASRRDAQIQRILDDFAERKPARVIFIHLDQERKTAARLDAARAAHPLRQCQDE